MRQMKISIAILLSIITILAAISPALAATPQQSMRPRERTDSSWISGNWAGYAVTGADGSITSVSGSWTVPAVTASKKTSNAWSAFWVGIDGYSSSSVEQIGTDSDIKNGKAVYYAWYEFYPLQPMQTITGFTVNPGDQISASVVYTGSSNTFTLTITDSTNGNSQTIVQDASKLGYSVQLNSAEWIAEAPSSNVILPLANFGSVTFTSCQATMGTSTLPIGLFGSSAIQQISMGTVHGRTVAYKATTSNLIGLDSFKVNWVSS